MTRLALLLCGALLLAGCHEPGDSAVPPLERIRAATATPAVTASSTPLLAGETLVPVPAEDGHAAFAVAARTPKLQQYPCVKCHRDGVLEREQKDAHWRIKLQHAPEAAMSCRSCHGAPRRFGAPAGQGTNEMQALVSLEGQPIDYNRVDRLCAQCHFQQARDWRGGAHGKRKGGWAPPRVATACTGCHDPHAPAFPQRWPTTYGSVPASTQGDHHGG